MLEKPNLSDAQIISALGAAYSLSVNSLDFLPIGNDAGAWVYRVDVAGAPPYFLKVKRGPVAKAALHVPRYLSDLPIEQIVAPLPTRTGALTGTCGGFTLILYPFIEGRTGMEIGMSDRQWLEFGATLGEIHRTILPTEIAAYMPGETFVPKWAESVGRLAQQIRDAAPGDRFQRELAEYWRSRDEEIRQLVLRTEELGRALRGGAREFVLCHADIHTANVLLDGAGRLHMIDWDEIICAPKERDLMFVVDRAVDGSIVPGSAEAHIFAGYGPTVVDPVALAYYRYEWVVQEIGDFGARIFFDQDVGEETRADAVLGFRELFEPGDVVDGAYNCEKYLR